MSQLIYLIHNEGEEGVKCLGSEPANLPPLCSPFLPGPTCVYHLGGFCLQGCENVCVVLCCLPWSTGMLWEGREGAGWGDALCSTWKKSLEGCAREIFGKDKDAYCPEGKGVVECLLLKLFNFKSLYCVLYPCSLPYLLSSQASLESTTW